MVARSFLLIFRYQNKTIRVMRKLIVGIGTLAVEGLIAKWLWNGCLVDMVDGLGEVSYWQALGLIVLVRVITNK